MLLIIFCHIGNFVSYMTKPTGGCAARGEEITALQSARARRVRLRTLPDILKRKRRRDTDHDRNYYQTMTDITEKRKKRAQYKKSGDT